MNNISKDILQQVSDLHNVPRAGIFNIRENGKLLARNTDNEVQIISKTNTDGIDVIIAPNTKNKSIHIPVIVTIAGMQDKVLNDFIIGDNCDILIVAGCGIHNTSDKVSSHNGIHSFHIGNNCNVKYVEKHIGIGDSNSSKVLNPITEIYMDSNSIFQMDTVQLSGVTSSTRKTTAVVGENSTLLINEKIQTNNSDYAKTDFKVTLKGNNSKVEVVSHAVAQGNSKQHFNSNIIGKIKCFGHVECDGILCDKAQISSTPKIVANSTDAILVHEAAIGKISEEQQNKLMTLGLTKEQAEETILKGFLK